MPSPIVAALLVLMLAGCSASPALKMRDDVAPEDYRGPTERPSNARRYVILQSQRMVTPRVRVHRVLFPDGAGLDVTCGGWIDEPVYFLPGTATFDYTCADGKHREKAPLRFARAGSYTVDCAADGSLVAVGPAATAF